MKTSVGLAFPDLLVGLLCLQSVCGQLSREHHQLGSDTSQRSEFEDDHGSDDQLIVDNHVVEGDSLRSPELHRADYDDSRQVRVEAGQQVLPPRTSKSLHTSADQVVDSGAKADFPCPVAAAIFPCVCSYDVDYNIDLDCTLVESEEQLADVFQQEFPVQQLRWFNMTDNDAVKVFGNILNGVSFKGVYLCCGNFALYAISEYFFLPTKDSLIYLRIENSQLTSELFPFAALARMEKLQTINITSSSISWIPKILAPKISSISFMRGRTEIIKSGTFPIHAQRQVIYVRHNIISIVEPGSFYWANENSKSSNEGISINLFGNRLESLEAGTFLLRDGPMSVWLGVNRLASIAPGTFVLPPTTDSFSMQLSLQSNQMKTFDEDVFGELMPYMERLLLISNPFKCGCDIAWLVSNANYMSVIDDNPTCANGTNLLDLDPKYYEAVC